MNKTLLVLPKTSRFEKVNGTILSGPAGALVDSCLTGYDTCYADEFTQTTHHSEIILTGQASLDAFAPGHDLNMHRGYVWTPPNRKIIATYWPQDCVDMQDYESDDEDDEASAGSTGKDGSPTSRANYRFWFMRDLEKLRNTPAPLKHEYNLVGNLRAASILAGAKGEHLYFDLESHPQNYITCFSFALGDSPVYTCSIYYRGQMQAHGLTVMAALARAFSRNKIIIHNAGFDLPFLALFHNIPFGPDIEDTMLMGHRIWPEAEKSLAHAITLWLNEYYHKNTGGTWNPRTPAQLDTLLRYNSKDVATLRAVHRAQWRYAHASGDSGLVRSMVQVNSSIYNYLWAGLHGFPLNGLKLAYYLRRRRADKEQWNRIINIAVGYPMNPGSSQQLGDYFINRLKYDVLKRTETGAPKCDEATLYKYLLKYSNPAVRLILKYKRALKVHGELGFETWNKQLKYEPKIDV